MEKLPELTVSTDSYNFKGGFLHQIPLRFDFGIGRYSEPSHSFQDDRAVLGTDPAADLKTEGADGADDGRRLRAAAL